MAVYGLQLALLPARVNTDSVVLPSIGQFPHVFALNVARYLYYVGRVSPVVWLVSFALVCFVFLSWCLANSQHRWQTTVLATLGFAIVAVIASGGIVLVIANNWIGVAPRFRMGFAAWLAMLAIVGSTLTRPQNRLRIGNWGRFLLLPFVWYLLSFVFVFASALHIQDDSFVGQTRMLMPEVYAVFQPGDMLVVDDSTIFVDSPVFVSAAENFPILNELVPTNEGWLWPQYQRMRAVSGIDSFVPYAERPDLCLGAPEYLEPTMPGNYRWRVFRSPANAVCVLSAN